MSFLKKLFGRGAGGAEAPAPGDEVAYNGFVIRAAPYVSEGQYQTAGVIAKEVGGIPKKHEFVRAERHASREEAVAFTLMKGRQIVDQMGERVFG